MKCKELAKEYGVTPMRIGKIRRKQWDRASGDLTEEQVEYVRSELERQNRTDIPVEEFEPKEVRVVVTHPGYLPRYVECMEKGRPGRFHLLLPFGVSKSNFPQGKTVKAIFVNENGKHIYIHASLARKGWEYAERK